MIQRVQTLYMILALVALAMAFVFPQISLKPAVLLLNDLSWSFFPLGLLIGVVGANIFNYKKRPQQLALGRLSIIIGFLSFAYLAYGHFSHSGEMPGYAMVAPLIAVVLLSLANKGIKKDEELVQSTQRFR